MKEFFEICEVRFPDKQQQKKKGAFYTFFIFSANRGGGIDFVEEFMYLNKFPLSILFDGKIKFFDITYTSTITTKNIELPVNTFPP